MKKQCVLLLLVLYGFVISAADKNHLNTKQLRLPRASAVEIMPQDVSTLDIILVLTLIASCMRHDPAQLQHQSVAVLRDRKRLKINTPQSNRLKKQ